jgi:hypothetical protein
MSPLDLHERFRRVTGFDLTELCGMTEALSYVTNPPFGARSSVRGQASRGNPDALDDQGNEVPAARWRDPGATRP